MNIRRNRTYGRRKGKSLRPRQRLLLDEFLPQVELDLHQIAVAPEPAQTHYPADYWLEIGFGGGEHLADLAARKPMVSFIGCEPFLNGVVKLLAAIEQNGLRNIRIHPGDAMDAISKIPDAFLGRIYLLYPDPWPKPRQQKRRIINKENLDQFARVLAPQGQLRFASDIPDYCTWTKRRIAESKDFNGDDRNPNEHSIPWSGWLPTRYETKARKAGRSTEYLIFTRK